MMGRNGPIFRLLRAEDDRREDETAVHLLSDHARYLSRVRVGGPSPSSSSRRSAARLRPSMMNLAEIVNQRDAGRAVEAAA